ncbi:hypothetical protein [Neisseria dumasiana]|nr:hypothetical protein [Neisseria dumasiana]UOO85474.1 hypothetical protein LVJ88_05780 [Neisseria dumasiana]
MSDLYPDRILQVTVEKGMVKVQAGTLFLTILGFLGGMFISLGYLLI